MKTTLHANGVELCAETFGDRDHPALLLIMGSSASMDWWEDDFCARLAGGGRFVVRYDHRDTGESVVYEPGEPPYTGADLAADAIGVLDALGIDRAHLAGMSMGAAIAQVLALEHPERIASLTLISTSPISGAAVDAPPMDHDLVAAFNVSEPDWSDRAAVIDYVTHLARASAARSQPFDEPAFRALAGRIVDRTRNVESSFKNHNVMRHGAPPAKSLDELEVPTLVIHGNEDPVFHPAHGEALAAAIPGASLLTLPGTGHELPRRTWDVVAPAILRTTG
jgi:pimeloyl-ACP methyl ester carboxylesterase